MYLPAFDECTMQFIRDIVNGKKKVIFFSLFMTSIGL